MEKDLSITFNSFGPETVCLCVFETFSSLRAKVTSRSQAGSLPRLEPNCSEAGVGGSETKSYENFHTAPIATSWEAICVSRLYCTRDFIQMRNKPVLPILSWE